MSKYEFWVNFWWIQHERDKQEQEQQQQQEDKLCF